MKKNYFSCAVLGSMIFFCADVYAQSPAESNTDERGKRLKLISDQEALEIDLKLIAKAKGWTLEEARADYEAAKAVGAAAEKLAKSRPDLFVGSVLSKDPGGMPSLYIKGSAPNEVYDMMAKSNVHINIVDQQPMSFIEIEQRANQVHANMMELGYQDFATSFDFRNEGMIDLVVTEQAGKRQFANAVTADLPKSLQSYVNVEMVQKPVGVLHNSFGGMVTFNTDLTICTSGWSVEHPNGTTGVTTAAHCSTKDFIIHQNHGTHNMVFQGQHGGQWGDVEWYTTDQNEPPRFIGDPSNLVRSVGGVEARSNISVGESVCVYGAVSNVRDCSLDVENISLNCTIGGISYQRLVSMNGNVTVRGDSGGGWSVSPIAYGSVVGVCRGREVFSVADLYDEAIGVTVRTR